MDSVLVCSQNVSRFRVLGVIDASCPIGYSDAFRNSYVKGNGCECCTGE